MRPSDSNSQIRADHYSAMGHMPNGGGGGGGGPQQDEMTRTHGNFNTYDTATPTKLLSDPDEMGHNPDFMMTMSPQVSKGRNALDMHTEDTTVDNSFPPS